MPKLKLKQIGPVQIATCPRCKYQWSTRKPGGGKKCPRCQQQFKGE